jgi:hypothetical protein
LIAGEGCIAPADAPDDGLAEASASVIDAITPTREEYLGC